jgi:hypothetical protein
MLESSRNASRFADTRVTFYSKLFVDTWERSAGSVYTIYLYILETLQIQVVPGPTCKTCPSSTGPSVMDSVTSNHIFKEEKMEKRKKTKKWQAKFLIDTEFVFTLEAYANDPHGPNIFKEKKMEKRKKTKKWQGKFLIDTEFAFTLEAYVNDTHTPNILLKESNHVLQSIIDSW